MSEVVLSINTLSDYSSPGADNLLNRDLTNLLHEGDDGRADPDSVNIIKYIHKILSNFWHKETVPVDLKQSVIVPFLKDSTKDASDPSNYRPISLLNSLMKTYEQIIKFRLMKVLEDNDFFSITQSAYRKGRSACDNLLVLQEVFHHYRYIKRGPRGGIGRKPFFLCFLDFVKAFDKVHRDLLFQKLAAIGILERISNVIRNVNSSK